MTIPDLTVEDVTVEQLDAAMEAARERVQGTDADVMMAALYLFRANYECTCGEHEDEEDAHETAQTCASLYACALLLERRARRVC